jgi:hypothetical protein
VPALAVTEPDCAATAIAQEKFTVKMRMVRIPGCIEHLRLKWMIAQQSNTQYRLRRVGFETVSGPAFFFQVLKVVSPQIAILIQRMLFSVTRPP